MRPLPSPHPMGHGPLLDSLAIVPKLLAVCILSGSGSLAPPWEHSVPALELVPEELLLTPTGARCSILAPPNFYVFWPISFR